MQTLGVGTWEPRADPPQFLRGGRACGDGNGRVLSQQPWGRYLRPLVQTFFL